MEFLKQWTLAVCMACLAAGILQQFAAAKARFSVIKLVLTLYILISAFAPLQALRYPETRMSLPVVAETAPIDTDSMILSAAQQNLSDTVMAACAAGGCPLDSVAVQLHANDGIVTLDRVILTPAQGTEAEKAIQLTRSALGGEISVTIQKEA